MVLSWCTWALREEEPVSLMGEDLSRAGCSRCQQSSLPGNSQLVLVGRRAHSAEQVLSEHSALPLCTGLSSSPSRAAWSLLYLCRAVHRDFMPSFPFREGREPLTVFVEVVLMC